MLDPTDCVLTDIYHERRRQDEKWGEQNHPDGTAKSWHNLLAAENARKECEYAADANEVTWAHILNEEVREAYAEEGPARLRQELIQVAAVAVAWVEAIDRRSP